MSEPIFVMKHIRDTGNYRVYEGGGTFQAQDGRGQPVIKNVILGANGTIYVGTPIAQNIDAWVLVPKKLWDAMHSPAVANARPQVKKGKK